MTPEQTYEVFYDETADFLEIFIGSPTKCYAEETEAGIVIRKDEKNRRDKEHRNIQF